MIRPTRRRFTQSAASGVAGLAAGTSVIGPNAHAQPAGYNADAMAAEISARLFASDGLARPAPEQPTVSDLAKGLDRTLVLGGGGEYYVAWYCGFLHGLLEQNVDLDIAEMIVGTSARRPAPMPVRRCPRVISSTCAACSTSAVICRASSPSWRRSRIPTSARSARRRSIST